MRGVRALPGALIHALVTTEPLSAHARGNVVFPLLGKRNTPAGAELRGTTQARWPAWHVARGKTSITSAWVASRKPADGTWGGRGATEPKLRVKPGPRYEARKDSNPCRSAVAVTVVVTSRAAGVFPR
ncbi:MAG: hypothetical protein JXB46_06985 [Candidatus Eisenbacteria bacterium]|nr:hypothetical protein [Candidatus Eisenbacteria bacterium]